MATRVLVVAESIDLRRLMAASIAVDGHSINTAADTAEALRKLRASPLAVVAFFDYRLPDAESALAMLPIIEQGGPELQRHRYVLLTETKPDSETQALADRLGVVVLVVPCTLGDLTWEITKQARKVEEAQGAEGEAGAEGEGEAEAAPKQQVSSEAAS